MKKSTYIATILGSISVLIVGVGMCMCLLPQWKVFQEGIIVGCVGLVGCLISIVVYRKMEHKTPIKLTSRNIKFTFLILLGIVALGAGMSLTMVYDNFIVGIAIGVCGILLLLCTVPLWNGIKE